MLITLACVVLCIVGAWKIFVKMGEPGWKAIIPIYNVYILFRHVWETKMFWIYLAASVLAGILGSSGTEGETFGRFGVIISGALGIVVFVIVIMLTYKFAKAFGHGVGYTIGMILVPFIFTLILGFGSSQYRPAGQGMYGHGAYGQGMYGQGSYTYHQPGQGAPYNQPYQSAPGRGG